VKVAVGELIDTHLSGACAVDDHIEQGADGQVDAPGRDGQLAAAIKAVTILCHTARRDAANRRARQPGIEP
jgi:hypothetical protein